MQGSFETEKRKEGKGLVVPSWTIKKIPAASRRGILDAFEKSLAKPNSIFAPRGEVLDPKLRNQ
jgi:hypothetical protein